MLKYLRIAVTALSLTACVLLVALWVRSYSRLDYLYIGRLCVVSSAGRSNLYIEEDTRNFWRHFLRWESYEVENAVEWRNYLASSSPEPYLMPVPHWLFILVSLMFAVTPWIKLPKRFSLRTLLIAMTLVAVGLGTVIYLAR